MSLPSGYKRLGYIQSSGTQWIDTGVKAKNDTKVIVDCEITYGTGWVKILGSYEAGVAFSWWANASNIYAYYGTEEKLGVGATGKHILTANGNMWSDSVNDFAFSYSSFTATRNLYLFSVNGGGTYDNARMKLYSCQIYDGETIIRDFVPCINASGEVGLYDLVGKQFYGNAGTGTFAAGPEVQKAPSTPTGFAASALTDTTVKLNWAASDGATGYKMYKNGALLATLTDTSYTDTVELFSGNTYSVTAYNDDGESEAATLTYYAAPENPILHLVTDRTQADVTAGNAKGTYTAVDLNRVGAAMNYVADRLREAGYDPHISPKTDCKDDDWVDPAAQAVYLGDLAELRKQFTMLESTPEVPPRILATGINTNDGLTHTWANDIERILEDVDALLTNISAAWFFSGDLFSGEV